MRVVLASASPRRRELLSLLGIEFAIVSPDVDESVLSGESPVELVERLAYSKARCCAEADQERLVIAADTVVLLDGQILGKPRDKDEARSMLSSLSGRCHEVWTGMAFSMGCRSAIRSSMTRVEFCHLTEAIILKYVGTGEPMDKAGAYGIQGIGGQFIRRLEGSYTNVMGLDLVVVREELEKLGYRLG
jgi:septum formation protein